MALGTKRKAANTLSKQPLDLPPATVHAFAGTASPEGWAMCDGSEVSRTDNAALFAAIGTTYGVGDGSTTFNLPDMRGEFLRGLDNMGTAAGAAGNDVDGTARTVGQTQANATAVNGLATNTTGSAHEHDLRYGTGSNTNGGYINPGSSVTGPAGNFANNSVQTGSSTHTHGMSGDTETRPRNIGINYIIKL